MSRHVKLEVPQSEKLCNADEISVYDLINNPKIVNNMAEGVLIIDKHFGLDIESKQKKLEEFRAKYKYSTSSSDSVP